METLTLSGFLFRDRPRTKGASPPWTPQAWAAGPLWFPPAGCFETEVSEETEKGKSGMVTALEGKEELRLVTHSISAHWDETTQGSMPQV